MYQKDFLQSSNRPQLVSHYINACNSVYGNAPFIPNKLHAKFSVFEDDLREYNIPPRDYAYTIINAMKGFVTHKKWKYVPVNLFLSDYCLNKYKKIAESETVKIDSDDTETILFRDEIMVARVFIEKNVKSDGKFIRFSDVVNELKPLLSTEWLQVYVNKGHRPEDAVLDQLQHDYRISKTMYGYLDIVDALRC